jgi:hypothetical protein
MPKTERTAKHFTIEQANAMLPLVRAIATDLTTLAHDVMERRERLASFAKRRASTTSKGTASKGNASKGTTDPYGDELAIMQQTLVSDGQRLQGYIDELRALGLEPKGALEGLVDFPSLLEGRPVYLCWKLGEAEVTHWHDLDAGFAGRQSLVAGVSSGNDETTFDSFTSPDDLS